MRCTSCNNTAPFLEDSPQSLPCMFCEGKQYPDEVDLLSQPMLGLVKEIRPGQINLAERISVNIRSEGAAIYEAGTGVGKSFAYLLPAILSGERVIISTAKKALQAQLMQKDLPYLQDMLQSLGHARGNFSYFEGYGKSNYACLASARREHQGEVNWPKYEKFFKHSEYGRWEDGRKLHLRLDESLNASDCIGPDCSLYKRECGYVKARKKMLEADVVVTNNWLLGYHYRLRREMPHFLLLGEFKHVIVDEAHAVEEGIRAAFTYETNLNVIDKLRRQFKQLQKNAHNPAITMPELFDFEEPWVNAFNELQRISGTNTSDLTDKAAEHIKEALEQTDKLGDFLASRSTLDNLLNGVQDSTHTLILNRWLSKPLIPDSSGPAITPDSDDLEILASSQGFPKDKQNKERFFALDKTIKTLKDCKTTMELVLKPRPNHTWTIKDVYRPGAKKDKVLQDLPVNIGSYMPDKHITYLSATLAIDDAFDVFARRVGLYGRPFDAELFPSPFNLKKQAWLYIPTKATMPEPDTRQGEAQTNYRNALSNEVHKLIEANRGDAFVLFSSNAELNHVKDYLRNVNYPYPVFAQGDYTPEDALVRYRATPQATLLGSKSFWEGVDVSGDKLSLVIITKLPFPHQSDPIIKARLAMHTMDAFSFVCVPDMLFDLRQGIGRLIRSQTDRGVIAVLDSRIYSKPYKNRVLRLFEGLSPYHKLDIICRGLATRHG